MLTRFQKNKNMYLSLKISLELAFTCTDQVTLIVKMFKIHHKKSQNNDYLYFFNSKIIATASLLFLIALFWDEKKQSLTNVCTQPKIDHALCRLITSFFFEIKSKGYHAFFKLLWEFVTCPLPHE